MVEQIIGKVLLGMAGKRMDELKGVLYCVLANRNHETACQTAGLFGVNKYLEGGEPYEGMGIRIKEFYNKR